MFKKKDLREVPFKNYVILGVVIIATMILLYYFYLWVDVFKESRSSIPILNNHMSVIKYNELGDYLVENPNSFIYVSVLEDDDIRKFEVSLLSKIKNDNISDVLYLDLTNELKNNRIKYEIEKLYSYGDMNITSVPCIVTFRDGKIIDIYNIKDNKYDVSDAYLVLENREVYND